MLAATNTNKTCFLFTRASQSQWERCVSMFFQCSKTRALVRGEGAPGTQREGQTDSAWESLREDQNRREFSFLEGGIEFTKEEGSI